MVILNVTTLAGVRYSPAFLWPGGPFTILCEQTADGYVPTLMLAKAGSPSASLGSYMPLVLANAMPSAVGAGTVNVAVGAGVYCLDFGGVVTGTTKYSIREAGPLGDGQATTMPTPS